MLETQLCWKWSNSEAEQTNGGHNQVGEVEIRKMMMKLPIKAILPCKRFAPHQNEGAEERTSLS